MNADSSWVERLYTDFLARDLAYLFAGGLFISIIEYTLYTKIFLPQQISLELFGFLGVSYFLGIIFHQIGNLFPFLQDDFPNGYQSEIVLFQYLFKEYDKRVINLLERTRFHFKSAITIGISSFLGGILMTVFALYRWLFEAVLPSELDIGLIFGIVSFGIVNLYMAKDFREMIGKDYKEMIKKINQTIDAPEKNVSNRIKNNFMDNWILFVFGWAALIFGLYPLVKDSFETGLNFKVILTTIIISLFFTLVAMFCYQKFLKH
jgi:hypothetical protein